MIVVIGGEKGGTGKTTIATNLAAFMAGKGRSVMLVDSDRQKTATKWAAERSENKKLPKVHCVEKSGNVFKSLQDLAEKYDEVIVDVGGQDSKELRTAVPAANKFYSPIRPSQYDLYTVEQMDMITERALEMGSNVRPYFLLSQAPTNPRISEDADATKLIKQARSMKLSKQVMRARKPYRDAAREGKGVTEMRTTKATLEVQNLAKEIYGGRI